MLSANIYFCPKNNLRNFIGRISPRPYIVEQINHRFNCYCSRWERPKRKEENNNDNWRNPGVNINDWVHSIYPGGDFSWGAVRGVFTSIYVCHRLTKEEKFVRNVSDELGRGKICSSIGRWSKEAFTFCGTIVALSRLLMMPADGRR